MGHSQSVRFSVFEVSEEMLSIWVCLAARSQQKNDTSAGCVCVHGDSRGNSQFTSTFKLSLPFKCNEEEEETWELSWLGSLFINEQKAEESDLHSSARCVAEPYTRLQGYAGE